MLCDDSAVIRAAIGNILQADRAIKVVGKVTNGEAAVAAVASLKPDVLILDIEMPVMDGLTALPLLLRAAPRLAVIMASTLTTRGADVAMKALRLGAADYVPKPSANALAGDQLFGPELLAKIHGLARLRRRSVQLPGFAAGAQSGSAACSAIASASGGYMLRAPPRVPPRLLAIGSSTGGPNALFTLVQSLPRDLCVPVVLTQHMPRAFTAILAQHIDKLGILPCAEAQGGETLQPGQILLAPGDRHMLIQRKGGKLTSELSDSPPENFCRPAVDPMLRSACAAAEGRVLVAMLTGMGQDGLLGTRMVIEAGGGLVAQDEASSVVWGMPGAVARAGLACAVLPLPQIGPRLAAIIAGGRV